MFREDYNGISYIQNDDYDDEAIIDLSSAASHSGNGGTDDVFCYGAL